MFWIIHREEITEFLPNLYILGVYIDNILQSSIECVCFHHMNLEFMQAAKHGSRAQVMA